MGKAKPTIIERWRYEQAAREYMAELTDENFMESTAQARQRTITLESMDVVRVARPDVQTFNELLLQYPKAGAGKRNIAGVVPDNMVVVYEEPIVAEGSYALTQQPVKPLVVMEYVSKSNERKDYDRNMVLYERDVKVPYYLVFYPDAQELNLYKLKQGKYESVIPNATGLRRIPKLELAVGLLGGWVRYWFRGELVPLPDELVRERDAERQGRIAERQARLDAEAEVTRLKAELARLRDRPAS